MARTNEPECYCRDARGDQPWFVCCVCFNGVLAAKNQLIRVLQAAQADDSDRLKRAVEDYEGGRYAG